MHRITRVHFPLLVLLLTHATPLVAAAEATEAGPETRAAPATRDTPATPSSPSDAAPLSLDAIFTELRARHPALAAARAESDAARARVAQQQAWMDPRLTVEQMRDNTRLDDYSELKLTVAQELPLSGRNTLRARAAGAEAAVLDSAARIREWRLLDQARTTFVRLAATDERLALNQKLRELARQSAALARLAYENGRANQTEALLAETELARLDAERTELAAARATDRARLNALLLRPADTPLGPVSLPSPAPPALDASAAVARARAASPEIAAALRAADAAEARLALADKNRAIDPELMVSARHMRGMGGDPVTAFDTGVSFSLPWFQRGRTDAERTEARARLAAARADADATAAEVAGMAAAAHARASAAHEQVLRQSDQLAPLARASAEAARRDYEAGRGPLLTVLAAERVAVEAELRLAYARAELALADAELAFLTVQDLATP